MTQEQYAAGSPGRFLDVKEVAREIGCHRSTIYRMCEAGEFPTGVLLLKRRRRWTEREVEEWKIKALAEASA